MGPPASLYTGGYYHGKLVFPKEYPFKAPSIYMLTPNGRFKVLMNFYSLCRFIFVQTKRVISTCSSNGSKNFEGQSGLPPLKLCHD